MISLIGRGGRLSDGTLGASMDHVTLKTGRPFMHEKETAYKRGTNSNKDKHGNNSLDKEMKVAHYPNCITLFQIG